MDTLSLRLQQLIFAYWRIPDKEGRVLWRLLQHSTCARVSVLRHHLALAETKIATLHGAKEMDLGYTFSAVVTPMFVMAMVRDLHTVGSLSGAQCAIIEEAMLGCVSRDGRWKAV